MDTPDLNKALIKYTGNIYNIRYPGGEVYGSDTAVNVWIECRLDVDGKFVLKNKTDSNFEFSLFTKYFICIFIH